MSKNVAEEGKPIVLLRNLKVTKTRCAPSRLDAEKFTLDQVAANDIEITTTDGKAFTLLEVPCFLIDAFTKFQELDGCKTEGIFRKDGNSLRCKKYAVPTFFGNQQISPNFLVHDVCSWIKKFFRDLKQPLFLQKERELLKFAETNYGSKLYIPLIEILHRLPTSHLSTLCYLMLLLKEISKFSSFHQMTTDNLATVFAPSLFRCGSKLEVNPAISKLKLGSQEDLLRCMKKTNDHQVMVLKCLIENAESIWSPRISNKNLQREAVAPKPLKAKSKSYNAPAHMKSVSSSNVASESSATPSSKEKRSSSLQRIGLAALHLFKPPKPDLTKSSKPDLIKQI